MKSLMLQEIPGIIGGSEGWAPSGKALSTSFPRESPNTTSGSALDLSARLSLPDASHFDAFIWLFVIFSSQGRGRNRETRRAEVLY